MTWNMMFQWIGHRMIEILAIMLLLAVIVFFVWTVFEAMVPMQEIYQLSRG